MSRKRLKGTIKRLRSAKTVAVEVVRVYHHPLYRKRIRASKTYLAHFEGEIGVGQPVVIEEGRPVSKSKRWRVVEVGGKPLAAPQQVKRTRSKEDRYSTQRQDKKEKVKSEEPKTKRRKAKRNGKN